MKISISVFLLFLLTVNGSSIPDSEDDALELPEALIHSRMDALFKLIDKNEDLKLDRHEVEKWIEVVGKSSKERYINSELFMLDTDGDSKISLSEYLGHSTQSDDDLAESARNRFVSADLNEDGFVSGSELEVLLKTVQKSDREIDEYAAEVLTSHDVNKDGHVSFDEFIEVAADNLMATFESMKDSNETSSSSLDEGKPTLTTKELDLLREEFGDIDINRDGFIDVDEIRSILKEEEDAADGLSLGDFSSPEEIESHADSVFSILNEPSSSISYSDVMSNMIDFAHSVLTDSGEILRFPNEYGLESLVNGTGETTTTQRPSRVEL